MTFDREQIEAKIRHYDEAQMDYRKAAETASSAAVLTSDIRLAYYFEGKRDALQELLKDSKS